VIVEPTPYRIGTLVTYVTHSGGAPVALPHGYIRPESGLSDVKFFGTGWDHERYGSPERYRGQKVLFRVPPRSVGRVMAIEVRPQAEAEAGRDGVREDLRLPEAERPERGSREGETFNPAALSSSELREALETKSPNYSRGWLVLHEKYKKEDDRANALGALERAARTALSDYQPELRRRLDEYRRRVVGPESLGEGGEPPPLTLSQELLSTEDQVCRLFAAQALDSGLDASVAKVVEYAREAQGHSGVSLLHSFVLSRPSVSGASAATIVSLVATLRECGRRVLGADRSRVLNLQAETFRKLGLRLAAGASYAELAGTLRGQARANALAAASDEFRLAGQLERARRLLEQSVAVHANEHNRRRLADFVVLARRGPGSPEEPAAVQDDAALLVAPDPDEGSGALELDAAPYSEFRGYLKTLCESAPVGLAYQGSPPTASLALRAFDAGEAIRREAMEALRKGRNRPALEEADVHLGTASRVFYQLMGGAEPSRDALRCWSTFLATRGLYLLGRLSGDLIRGLKAGGPQRAARSVADPIGVDVVTVSDAVRDLLALGVELNIRYEWVLSQEEGGHPDFKSHVGEGLRHALLAQYTKAALIGDFWDGDRRFFDTFRPTLMAPWFIRLPDLSGDEPWFRDLVGSLVHHWAYLATRVWSRAWSRHLSGVIRGSPLEKGIRQHILGQIPEGEVARIWAELKFRPGSQGTMNLLRVYARAVLEPAANEQTRLVDTVLTSGRSGREQALDSLRSLASEKLWQKRAALKTFSLVVLPIFERLEQLSRRYAVSGSEELAVVDIPRVRGQLERTREAVNQYPSRENYDVVLPLVNEGLRQVQELEDKVLRGLRCEVRCRVSGAERVGDRVRLTVRLWNEGTATADDVVLSFSRYAGDVHVRIDPVSSTPRSLSKGGSFSESPFDDVSFELSGPVPDTLDLPADVEYLERQVKKTLSVPRVSISLAGPPPDPPGDNPYDPAAGYVAASFKGRDKLVREFADRILLPDSMRQQYFVFGVPRIGKTWFLRGLADELGRREVRVGGKARPVCGLYLTLSHMSGAAPGDPYDLLVSRIHEMTPGLARLWRDRKRRAFAKALLDTSTWSGLLKLIDQHQVWVVFLLDEFQFYFLPGGSGLVPPSVVYGPGFFNTLRGQAEVNRAGTVYCGLWEAEHYIKSPTEALPAATFSTAAAPLYLPPLDREGCSEIWRSDWLEFDTKAEEALYDLSAGIPGIVLHLLRDCRNAAVTYGLRRLSEGHVEDLIGGPEFASRDQGVGAVLESTFSTDQLLPAPGDREEFANDARRILMVLARARLGEPGGWAHLDHVSLALGTLGAKISGGHVAMLLDGMVKRHWVKGEPGGRYRLQSRLLANRLVTTFPRA
jgi:hypothetical protein